jgi:5-methylcytosine-specific restriction endonuclease McrA
MNGGIGKKKKRQVNPVSEAIFEKGRIVGLLGFQPKKAKHERIPITSKEKVYIWEHPEMYGRTCSICSRKITRLSDLEFDHTKPLSKGGIKQALAHRDCNRMKASGSLRKIQKTMGFPTKKTRRKTQSKTKPRKKKKTSPFDLPEIKLP